MEITCSVKDSLPSFSYQAILSSRYDALKTSISPSPSTSIAKTDIVKLALVEILCSVKLTPPPTIYKGLAPWVVLIAVSALAELALYLAKADTVPHFAPDSPEQVTVTFAVNVSLWFTS